MPEKGSPRQLLRCTGKKAGKGSKHAPYGILSCRSAKVSDKKCTGLQQSSISDKNRKILRRSDVFGRFGRQRAHETIAMPEKGSPRQLLSCGGKKAAEGNTHAPYGIVSCGVCTTRFFTKRLTPRPNTEHLATVQYCTNASRKGEQVKKCFYQVLWVYYDVIGNIMCFWAAHPMHHHSRPHDFGLLQVSMKVLRRLAKNMATYGNTESNVTMIASYCIIWVCLKIVYIPHEIAI